LERYICIHGHFYQPPRENPWLEEVELQDSASPYHDWNERITSECYAPNTASRIVDGENRIISIINNYSKISFNIGPTLCSWMERHKPDVLDAIIEADKSSRERFSGHGSAIAQVYNHMIMPLANRRDKYTQAQWGIMDFEKRFGRSPEGIWLPETAVDLETLDVLAELKIKFTILAPRQAKRVKQLVKGARWHDVGEGIDPKIAYRCDLPSGRSINLFFYDGPISHDMAFGGLLSNGEGFAERLLGAFREDENGPQIVSIASDGESYGHHHRYGEMALSYCLHHIESTDSARLTNYAEYLETHPVTHLVEILENSSWSCVHGVERWKENCGCNSGRQGWTQDWRKPLREALDTLRDALAPLYEQEAASYLHDPWRARDEYHKVISDRSRENVNKFLSQHASRELVHENKIRILRLLEMQRNCMLMYTSCGWFFDEISGIETTQVLQYAAKAIQNASTLFNVPFEDEFIKKLETAPSNVLENGSTVYNLYVTPARLDMLRVAAHYGIFSLFSEQNPQETLYCFSVESETYRKLEVGKFRLAVGKIKIASSLTWEEMLISFAVLHLGDHNVSGGVRTFVDDIAFGRMENEITREFEKSHMTEVIQLMLKHFGTDNYSIWHLFKDEQRKVLDGILTKTLKDVHQSLHKIYHDAYSVMTYLQSLRNPIPAAFLTAANVVVNTEMKETFQNGNVDLRRLEELIQQTKRWSIQLQKDELRYHASRWVNQQLENLETHPTDLTLLQSINRTLALLDQVQFDLDLWKAQNVYYSLGRELYPQEKQKAADGDTHAAEWIELFLDLGTSLGVKVE
jgi:alpha-amylase/alpha-mannosidase (GH57 family)